MIEVRCGYREKRAMRIDWCQNTDCQSDTLVPVRIGSLLATLELPAQVTIDWQQSALGTTPLEIR